MNTILPEDALDKHIAILGKTGSGKTYAAKVLVEHLLDQGRQVCVVDPTAAWWGLRLAADGKGPGYEVVLVGGKHGDIPLSERSGAAVARLVTGERASVVIDTQGLTVGEYTRWAIDFFGTLYTTIAGPLHLVVDEAHHFMPQGKAPDPQAGRMLHAGNRLMSGGRSLGIRGMLITQRPAKLHKDSLTCADTLVAMRVLSPQDRKADRDWIDGAGDPVKGKAILDSLAGLQRGDAWVWYPEGDFLERVHFPRIKTFDSSTAPKHGRAKAVKVGDINLDKVRESMAEAVKEAEANDPVLLRRKITELQAELKKRPTETKTVEKLVEKKTPVLKDGQLARVERVAQRTIDAVEKMVDSLGDLRKTVAPVFAQQPARQPPPRVTPPVPVLQSAPLIKRAPPPAPVESNGHVRIGTGERRVLKAIYWTQGDRSVDHSKICFFSGYSPASSSLSVLMSNIRKAGLAEPSGFRLTPEGRRWVEAAGIEPRPTGGQLREWMRPMLGRGENAILDFLLANPGRRFNNEELNAAAGYSPDSSSLSVVLAKLRKFEAIEGGARDGITAAGVFFE